MNDDPLRDRFFAGLANLVLRGATKEYRTTLTNTIKYGMNAAARDAFENREPPEYWKVYVERARKIRGEFE